MVAFFDTRAALVKIRNQQGTPATSATSATRDGKTGPHVASVADVAAPSGQNAKNQLAETEPSEPVRDDTRNAESSREIQSPRPSNDWALLEKFGAGGRPITWTGKVVSLEEWRSLTEWERHGPDGRHWNSRTRRWEEPQS